MNSSKKTIKSTVSIVLALIVFLMNSVLLHAAEANFWTIRHHKSVLQQKQRQATIELVRLPSRLGTVRTVSSHENVETTVLHIQDIHLNTEAQRNIGEVVQELMSREHVDLVALEGAFGPIDLRFFRTFPHQDMVRNVADLLLRENKISGPIHAALTSAKKIPPFVGIDDAAHYEKNVEAYRRSSRLKAQRSKGVQSLKIKLENKKRSTFNDTLYTFDQQAQAYHQKQISLGDYAKYLKQHVVLARARTQAFDLFLKILTLEDSLDLTRVEHQRTHFLATLMKHLDRHETQRFMNKASAYRTGQISHKGFYQFLNDLCDQKQLSLARFEALDDYIQYIMLSDSVDVKKLLTEVKKWESEIYESLIQTSKERKLVSESRRLYLIEKLIDFSLTPDDWKEYGDGRDAEDGLLAFEQFYEQAEQRDKKMSENLMAAMEEHKAKTAVLITGGFHAKGLARALEKRANVVSYVPRITRVDESNYLTIFTQEKTPLQRIFEGQKLFLSTKVMPGVREAKVMVLTMALGLKKLIDPLQHDASIGLNASKVVVKKTGKTITGVLTFDSDVLKIVLELDLNNNLIGYQAALQSSHLWSSILTTLSSFFFNHLEGISFWLMMVGIYLFFFALLTYERRFGLPSFPIPIGIRSGVLESGRGALVSKGRNFSLMAKKAKSGGRKLTNRANSELEVLRQNMSQERLSAMSQEEINEMVLAPLIAALQDPETQPSAENLLFIVLEARPGLVFRALHLTKRKNPDLADLVGSILHRMYQGPAGSLTFSQASKLDFIDLESFKQAIRSYHPGQRNVLNFLGMTALNAFGLVYCQKNFPEATRHQLSQFIQLFVREDSFDHLPAEVGPLYDLHKEVSASLNQDPKRKKHFLQMFLGPFVVAGDFRQGLTVMTPRFDAALANMKKSILVSNGFRI